MPKSKSDYASWLFYQKRIDDTQFDREPPGNLVPTRLIEGKSDYWFKSANQQIQRKKTLLLCDWSLDEDSEIRLRDCKKKIGYLLDSGFSVYLWQNENEAPLLLTKELVQTHNLVTKGAPCHINIIHRTMGELGVSPDELGLLDEHSLNHLHDDAITPYVIQIKPFVEHFHAERKYGLEKKYGLEQILEYVKSLSIDFVFNQNELSILQIEWVHANKYELEKYGDVTFNYRSVKICDEFIARWPAICEDVLGIAIHNLSSEKQNHNFNSIILAILEVVPHLEELDISHSRNIKEKITFKKNTFLSLKKLNAYNSLVRGDTLSSLLKAAPNLEVLDISYCKNLEGNFTLEKNTLLSLKKINAYNSFFRGDTFSSLSKAAPNLEKLDIFSRKKIDGTFTPSISLKKLVARNVTITKDWNERQKRESKLSRFFCKSSYRDYVDADTSKVSRPKTSCRDSVDPDTSGASRPKTSCRYVDADTSKASPPKTSYRYVDADTSKASPPKTSCRYVDADTSKASRPKTFKLKRHITGLSGPNPHVSAYRKTLFDTLTLTKEPTDIDHAFRLSSLADIQLAKTDITNSDCDLVDLGEVVSSTSDAAYFLGTDTIGTAYQWLPLPSITANDHITHLHLSPKVDYDLRYSERDNLYYIYIKSPIDRPVTVQYLFNTHSPIKKVSLPLDIAQLMDELNHYGDEALRLPQSLLTGAAYLAALKTQKVGSCRHRTIVFKALMGERFPDISCRIVMNDFHAFAEVNIDGQWLTCDLGGYPAKLIIEEPVLPKPMTPKIDTYPAKKTKAAPSAEALLLEALTKYYRDQFKLLKPAPSEALASSLLAESNKKHLLLCDSESLLKSALSGIYREAISEDRPIFWVTKPSDLLCQLPFIQRNTQDNSGQVFNGPGGPLYDFLMAHQTRSSRPILLVDYSTFKPHDIVRFNQLLDDTRKADGVTLPNDITIIGVQNKRHPNHYSGDDFSSRFDKKFPIKQFDITMKNAEPHDESEPMSESDEAPYIINLYHATNWEERLIGYWQLDGQQLKFVEGELTKALKTKELISILNAPEDTKAYQLFLEKHQIEGSLLGLPFNLNQITHAKGYEWDNKSLENIHLHQLSNEQWSTHDASDEALFLLNPSTYTKLFSSYQIEGQAIRTNDGALKTSQGGELTVYLTRDLSESQWAELIDSALEYTVKLTVLALPHVQINGTVTERLNGTAQMTDDTDADYQSSPFILSSDPDVSARARLDATTHIIDISEMAISDLFLKLDGRYDSDTQAFIFKEEKRLLLRELEKGHKFILTGAISEEKLDRLLPYLYQYRAQLILILKSDSLTPPENTLTESPSFADKCQLLSDEEQSRINLLISGNVPLFTQEALSKFSFSQLKAFLAYQVTHPNNSDINAAWLGIDTPAPHEIETSISEESLEADTLAFIQSRYDAIDAALSTSPLAFISGVTGCGKSAFIENHLIQTRKVYPHSSIQAWAKSPEGGVLFIDEANISQHDYTLFEGLFADTPFIIINDEYIELTPNHKVLMAGNPASYGGSRHTPSLLEQHGNSLTFDIMPPNVLFQLVVKPLFYHTPFESDAFNLSLALLEAYQWLLQQDREACHITPRDIKAIMMRTLAAVTPDDLVATNSDTLFKSALNQQLRNIIIPKLPKTLVSAFEKIVPEIKIREKSELPSYGDFIITDSRRAVSAAIDDSLNLRRYRQDNQAHFLPSQLTGDLSAIVLESEPGLGKTELVKAKLHFNGLTEGDMNTLDRLQNVYYNLPVTLSIKQKKELLLKAFIEGNVIIIDEINSSPMLEQCLNSLLMGQIPEDDDIKGSPYLALTPQPGFTVFGTQNPIYMQGRVNASIAENARRINYTLEHYTKNEMQQILTHKGLPNIHANALVNAYLAERQQAKTTHQDVIPNFRDLLRVTSQMLRKIAHNTQEDCLKPMDAQSATEPVFNRRLSMFKQAHKEVDDGSRVSRQGILI
jgi:hypothetical protein